jgi:hypothetical protein
MTAKLVRYLRYNRPENGTGPVLARWVVLTLAAIGGLALLERSRALSLEGFVCGDSSLPAQYRRWSMCVIALTVSAITESRGPRDARRSCPHCSKKMKAAEGLVGKKAKCG